MSHDEHHDLDDQPAYAPSRGRHGHTHGVIDPVLSTTARGIWALKWSFAGLMVTALLQVVIVWLLWRRLYCPPAMDCVHAGAPEADATVSVRLWSG